MEVNRHHSMVFSKVEKYTGNLLVLVGLSRIPGMCGRTCVLILSCLWMQAIINKKKIWKIWKKKKKKINSTGYFW